MKRPVTKLKKELTGDARTLFGSSPNMNMKLDMAAQPKRAREKRCQEHWGMTWDDVRALLPRREVPVYTVNLPAGPTCPGKSAACAVCYALTGRSYMQQPKYQGVWDALEERMAMLPEAILDLPEGSWVRIHASGDFYAARYIRAWVRALRARPDVKAWAYTRSWRVSRLRAALETLRALPNVQLFASIDRTIDDTSYPTERGWRVAFLEGDGRFSGMDCPEQVGDRKRPDCKACGYCILGRRGNVRFFIHSVSARRAAEVRGSE